VGPWVCPWHSPAEESGWMRPKRPVATREMKWTRKYRPAVKELQANWADLAPGRSVETLARTRRVSEACGEIPRSRVGLVQGFRTLGFGICLGFGCWDLGFADVEVAEFINPASRTHVPDGARSGWGTGLCARPSRRRCP